VTPAVQTFASLIHWAQQLLAEILQPGDLAVDLTAGKGADTRFLHRCVGGDGLVVSFDIQPQALQATEAALLEDGAFVRRIAAGGEVGAEPGVALVADGHQHLAGYLKTFPRGVIANLGYLPGSDRSLITRAETSCLAVREAARLLLPGGRMAIVVYPGHPGGAEEGAAVEAELGALPANLYQVLRLQLVNRTAAPYLLLVEKH